MEVYYNSGQKRKGAEALGEKYVLGIGAANVDVHGRSRVSVVMRDSNPGHLHTSVGGVTRNVLENLSRLGVSARMVSAVGDDVYGEMVYRESVSAGLDMSGLIVVPGESSSCYISMLDAHGDMLVAMSDMGILRHITPEVVDGLAEGIRSAEAVVCDPCLPVETVVRIIERAGDTPVFLDPVSTAYARAVAPVIDGLFLIKPNRMELSVLSGVETDTDEGLVAGCDALLRRGVRRVAVSLGERGCYYADSGGCRVFRALRPLTEMANANGAGDAFMAGLVYGHVRGLPAEETLDRALAAGIVAIRSEMTISPEMSEESLERALREFGC